MPLSKQQFEGVVLGLAIGDALGAPWEGTTSDLIFEMGPADRIVEHESGAELCYTDDTQMTIGVVQTLIEHGRIEKDSLARKFADNYHPHRGYGQGARQIINAIGAGEDWEQVASAVFQGKGSLGNGAAMRVAPLGLYFAPDMQRVEEQAVLSALPTHRHEIGIDGARLLACAAALAAMSFNRPFDRQSFLAQLQSIAKIEEFQWQLGYAIQLEPYQSLSSFGSSLEAHRSVVTSIMCFANAPDSYEATVSRALSREDDVDTVAAMAGALSGARLGIDAIPGRLIACLEDNFQGRTCLLKMANELWRKHVGAT